MTSFFMAAILEANFPFLASPCCSACLLSSMLFGIALALGGVFGSRGGGGGGMGGDTVSPKLTKDMPDWNWNLH